MTTTFPTSADAHRAADLDAAREAFRVFPIHDRPTFGTFAVNYLRERGLEVLPVAPVAPGFYAQAAAPFGPPVTDEQRAALMAPQTCCSDVDCPGLLAPARPFGEPWAPPVGQGATCAEGGPCDCAPAYGTAAQAPPVPTGQQIAELLKQFRPALPESPFVDQALGMSVETIADLLAALAERDLRWIPGENGQCGTLLEGPVEPADLHVVFDTFGTAWQRDDERAASETSHYTASDRWWGTGGNRWTWAELQRNNGPLRPEGGIAPTTQAEVTR